MNQVILSGRTTADIELKTLPSGSIVTNFRLAVDRDVPKDSEKKTDFINITAWNKTAEFLAKYIGKGRRINIVGRLQTEQYTDSEGKTRTSYSVHARRVEFADGKPSNENKSEQIHTPSSSDLPDGYDEIDEDFPF